MGVRSAAGRVLPVQRPTDDCEILATIAPPSIRGGNKYTASGLAMCLCVSASIGIAIFVEPPIRAALGGLLTRISRLQMFERVA
jgi:hypothetical protein